jgi:CBS domain-containing protein
MSMTVGQLMTRPVIAASPGTSLRQIASQFVAAGISGMPIADRDGGVLGVVTEYDVVGALVAGKRLEDVRAGDVMAKPAITLDVDAGLDQAMRLFTEKHIIRVPITEGGKLVGILSRTDALRGLLDEPEFLVF